MELGPESLLWSLWLVRGTLMLCTLCQIILTLFGSKRHTIKNGVANILLWSTYMVANQAGTYLLGSMSAITSCYEDTNSKGALRLISFWAPFILFHLAGPDTITAYSLEDNELWLRSCLEMFSNVGVASYILVRYRGNDFLGYLSILILFLGIVKYIERILLLRSKSKQHLQGHIYISQNINFETFLKNSDLRNTFLYKAYLLHCAFAYRFGNLVVPFDIKEAKKEFVKSPPVEEAFRLVQIQLNLVYQVFYTKATVFCSAKGILFRYICSISLVATLVIFLSVIFPRSSYQTIDVAITCFLLIGAIFVEVRSYIILFLSDWRKLWLMYLKWSRLDSEDPSLCDSSKSECTRNYLFCLTMTRHPGLEIDPKNWSWSESLGQYNLINSCFKKASINHCFGVGRLLNEELEKQLNVTREEVTPDLQEFIVKHVVHGDHINEKGSWVDRYRSVLRDLDEDDEKCFLEADDPREIGPEASVLTETSDFGNSILYWHIATDICYHNHKNAENLKDGTKKLMGICKRLSDYILYLYVLCPSMISRGKSETVYPRICNNLLKVIEQRTGSRRREDIAKNLIRLEKTYRSKFESRSYLWHACQMANFFEIREWRKRKIWRMIRDVWREILGYAAIHCEWNEHIQQLGGGGELLTYVRFLILLYSK